MKKTALSLILSSLTLLGCEKKVAPAPITNGFTSLNGKAHADYHSPKIKNGILPTSMQSNSNQSETPDCNVCHTGPLAVNKLTTQGKKVQLSWIEFDTQNKELN